MTDNLKDPRMQKPCGYCGRNVYDPNALVSDRTVYCDNICSAEAKYEARKVEKTTD